MNLHLIKEWGVQIFLALDQFANVLPPPLDGTVGYADETLSARCYRAHRDGKVMGKVFMPLIDLLFFWQGPGHCKSAYIKEFERKNYPSEYRTGAPTFESRTKKK